MYEEQNDNSTLLNVLAGIGLGAIVGAAVALLFAPKAGTEVRDDIKHTLDDLKVKAEKLAGDLSVKGEELVSKGREAVDSASSKIKEAVNAGKDAVHQAQTEANEELEEVG